MHKTLRHIGLAPLASSLECPNQTLLQHVTAFQPQKQYTIVEKTGAVVKQVRKHMLVCLMASAAIPQPKTITAAYAVTYTSNQVTQVFLAFQGGKTMLS